jgi:hypothetical protein
VVEVTLNAGTTFSDRVGNVKGTAENRTTRKKIIAKARHLITPKMGAAKTQKLIDTVFVQEPVKSVLELRPLLQKA